MRHSELFTGIEVVDAKDNVVGVSKVAAAKALKETAATRAFLPAPILIIPPVMMMILERYVLSFCLNIIADIQGPKKFFKEKPKYLISLQCISEHFSCI